MGLDKGQPSSRIMAVGMTACTLQHRWQRQLTQRQLEGRRSPLPVLHALPTCVALQVGDIGLLRRPAATWGAGAHPAAPGRHCVGAVGCKTGTTGNWVARCASFKSGYWPSSMGVHRHITSWQRGPEGALLLLAVEGTLIPLRTQCKGLTADSPRCGGGQLPEWVPALLAGEEGPAGAARTRSAVSG